MRYLALALALVALLAAPASAQIISYGSTPAFTSVTTPTVIGGTGTTSTLALRPTSGAGTTAADIIFQVGNNGGTEAARVLNNGDLIVGKAAEGGAGASIVISKSYSGSVPSIVNDDTGASVLRVGTEGSGAVTFITSDTPRWRILGASPFDFSPSNDNVNDLGTASLRVRAAYIGTTGIVTNGPIKFANNNSTAAVLGAIGTTCPAVTCTAAYTWEKGISSDGSVVYFPLWK